MGYDYTFPRNPHALKADCPSDLAVELGAACASVCSCLGGNGMLIKTDERMPTEEGEYAVQETVAESVFAAMCVLEAILRKLPARAVAEAETECVNDMAEAHRRIAGMMLNEATRKREVKRELRELAEWLNGGDE